MKTNNVRNIFKNFHQFGENRIGALLFPVFALLLLASCSGDELTYEPAEPVAADNWGVYFAGRNASSFPRTGSDTNVLEFTVKRMNTKGALEVPLELEVTNGTFNAPKSVKFNDGEDETTFEVTYEGLELGKLTATLSLPESYTNPYKIKEGFFKQSIMVYEPVIISTNVKMEYVSSAGVAHDYFDNLTYTITQVPGENQFCWENFLGSGINLSFKIDVDNGGTFDEKDIKKCEGDILPINHYLNDDESQGWSFCTDEFATEESEAHVWTVTGTDFEIKEEAYFYYSGYLTIHFWDDSYGCGWGTIWSAVFDYDGADQYDNYYFWINY